LFVASARVLFNFAIERGLLDQSPALGIKGVKGGSWKPWPHDKLMEFINGEQDCFTLAAALGFYTAQRLSDILSLEWSAIDETHINFTQRKTGTTLRIPIHPDLLLPQRSEGSVILYKGKPINRTTFSAYFKRKVEKQFGESWPFHGIRKTAAQTMAQNGASVHDICSITGHKSLSEVARYTRDAEQVKIADRAIGFIK
jgi:integrase